MLHYTFDEYETTLELMLKHILNELRYYDIDKTYYNDKSLLKILRLRDSLQTALNATQEILTLID